MADQSVHDVVRQPQSVDALRSTDVSGINSLDSAARAVADDPALNDESNIKHTNLPLRTEFNATNAEPTERDAALNMAKVSRCLMF